jgi:hypothetical protein
MCSLDYLPLLIFIVTLSPAPCQQANVKCDVLVEEGKIKKLNSCGKKEDGHTSSLPGTFAHQGPCPMVTGGGGGGELLMAKNKVRHSLLLRAEVNNTGNLNPSSSNVFIA